MSISLKINMLTNIKIERINLIIKSDIYHITCNNRDFIITDVLCML